MGVIMGVCQCKMGRVRLPSDAALSHSAVQRSREAVGKVYEEEKEHMQKRIRELYDRALLNPRTLTTVNLSLCNLGSEGADHLSRLLAHTPALTVLKLWKCRLGPKGAEFLTGPLSALKKLKVLAVEDNRLGNRGTCCLVKGVEGLGKLEELYLHENQVTEEGVREMSKALKGLGSIRVFTIDENDIKSEGLLQLLSSLPLRNLTCLGLAYTNIDDSGLTALLQHLPHLPALHKLSIDGNPVSATLKKTCESAFKLPKLR